MERVNEHAHSHSHTISDEDISSSKLAFTVALNFIITIAEAAGGIISGSLALISDALHNLSDAVAIAIAWFAHIIGKRKSTKRRTFGYKRIEILAALFNSVALIAICLYLFSEAYERLIDPKPIKGLLMLSIAIIGLAANLAAVLLLKRDSHKNLNVKAAYLHLMGDTFSSIAVIIGGILIYFYEIYWVDPVITFLIGLYIIKETYTIIRDTISILMQSVPRDIDILSIQKDIENLPEVENIHHIHIWSLDDRNILFDCHIDLAIDLKTSETDLLRKKVEEILFHNYNISHVTIQAEYNICNDKNVLRH